MVKKVEEEPKQGAIEKRSPEELAELAKAEEQEKLHKFLFYGDLSSLSIQQQNEYLFQLAKSMDLNPWTKPFDLMPNSKGKLFVYANKGCAAQLRHTRSITLETIYEGPLRLGDAVDRGIYTVVVEASIPDKNCPDGQRKVRNVGAIGIDQLIGEARSNAIMKCYTKAIRRATLDVCGVGFPDESELDSSWTGQQEAGPRQIVPKPRPQELPQVATIPSGEAVNTKTGEIIEAVPVVPPAAPQPVPATAQAAPVAGRSKFPPAVAPVGVQSAKP